MHSGQAPEHIAEKQFPPRPDGSAAGQLVNAAAPATATVNDLLQAIAQGDAEALNLLLPLVYDELIALAHRQRQSWHGDLTMNTTALVHEVYLKLVDKEHLPAESRSHFFSVAAKAMRHILCNYARDRQRKKRGGDLREATQPVEELASSIALTDDQSEMLEAMDEALGRLESVAMRQARVVECRFFGGMSVEETAAVLGVSPRSVKRDWSFARAWLRRDMQLINDIGV
jgi:RNA polymerase sigma factor, TIGR02999 family